MIEKLSTDGSLRKVTPLDVARVAMRRRGIDPVEHLETNTTAPLEHVAGDVIERDGREYMLVPDLHTAQKWEDGKRVYYKRPYAYRQYYAHTFPEAGTGRMEPGPGWDSKFRLHSAETAIALHDRTFSPEELKDLPNNLPEDDCLFVSDLEGERVAEYLEYLEKIEH